MTGSPVIPPPKRHIPFGPQPPRPILSSTSLRTLLSLLIKYEMSFLTDVLPSLYPPAREPGSKPLEWSVAFEVMAFAAGLKQSVLIGWGDGRQEDGDARVAQAWIKDVWTRGIGRDINPPELADKPLKAPDPDIMQLRKFIEGCTFTILGPVAGRDTIWTGHVLVSWGPGGPGAKLLTSIPRPTTTKDKTDPTNKLATFSLSDIPPQQLHHFDESLLAHILDYPLPLPPKPKSKSTFAPQNVMITYGLAFSDMTAIGTQYLVPPIDSIVSGSGSIALNGSKKKDRTVREIVEDHFISYANYLEPVLSNMGGTLALSIQGKWLYGPNMQSGKKPDGLTTFGNGMGVANLEWQELSRAERGLQPFDVPKDLAGRRKWLEESTAAGLARSKKAKIPMEKDRSGLSLH